MRIDRAPKTLLVYRQAAPFAKVQTPELFVPTDGSETGIKCKVEILAGNLQFVASGIHPDTMEPYRWTGETPATVPLADLPEITEEQAKAFRDAAEAILRAAGGVEKAKPEPSPRPTRPSAPRRARSAPTISRLGPATCSRLPRSPRTAPGASRAPISAVTSRKTYRSPTPAFRILAPKRS